ncbi:MAG: Hpt domain-containing protein [Saprospiraceae bacterium]|nr:Hpt domain-containing protein [Saprospiraceae bacterium]
MEKIDPKKLLEMFGGDKAIAQRFIDLFVKEIPGLKRQLQEATEKNQLDEIGLHAHTIKSQCRYIGLDKMAEKAANIEEITEKGGSNQLNVLIQSLIADLDENGFKVIF